MGDCPASDYPERLTAAAIVLVGQADKVTAVGTIGTQWDIVRLSGCVFSATPRPVGASTPGILAANGDQVSFLFGAVAVSTVPGVATVGIDVVQLVGELPSILDTLSVSVTKTAAGFGIISVSASPPEVSSGESVALRWQTVGAANRSLSWDEPTTTVLASGVTVANGSPVESAATSTDPYTATVRADTRFTLTAQGTATVIAYAVATTRRPSLSLYADRSSVAPWGTVQLTWQGYDTGGLTSIGIHPTAQSSPSAADRPVVPESRLPTPAPPGYRRRRPSCGSPSLRQRAGRRQDHQPTARETSRRRHLGAHL